ncbi:MAG: GIY-YIG nuclease family protein [Daejeonella sp.]|uniref:GIY-YIG nuclease family protein n=1 Tax=Daejeonella sp. JGW-45 TaxID=3034148 RepID=UPI0023ED6421|nr:GIY-YIG nuclease family protein [Daejeonella sp. JGW-45]
MYFAYVIKSQVADFYYKGHCKDVHNRLMQHNSGLTVSIRPYLPFELAYFESFLTEKEAIAREKYFKSSAGRRYLRGKLTR